MININYLKLKNQNGEDIYKIGKEKDNSLYMFPQKIVIDIFDSLTLYNDDMGEICQINIGEAFMDTLLEIIESKVSDKEKVKDITSILDTDMIMFSSISECFPDNANQISELNKVKPIEIDQSKILDNMFNRLRKDKKPENLSAQDIYNLAQEEMNKNGSISVPVYIRLDAAIKNMGEKPMDYIRMDQANLIFNLDRWYHRFIEDNCPLTPQEIYNIAEKDMKENNGILSTLTCVKIVMAIKNMEKDHLAYIDICQDKFIFNLEMWKHDFLENK